MTGRSLFAAAHLIAGVALFRFSFPLGTGMTRGLDGFRLGRRIRHPRLAPPLRDRMS
jgi:hypothetical protein